MAGIKVYGPPVSTAVSRVLACLLEKEVEFQLLPISLAKRQHKTPDFIRLQPFGQVPAFQDGAATLFESRAICRYICDKYATSGNVELLRADSSAETKASVDQWVEAEAQSFNPPSSALVFQLVFAPRMRVKQDPAVIKESEGKLRKVLDVYEKRLGESRFLAGDHFTLADLCHLPNAHYLAEEGDRSQLFTSRKNVGRWWEEISNLPSWKKVVEMRNAPSNVILVLTSTALPSP